MVAQANLITKGGDQLRKIMDQPLMVKDGEKIKKIMDQVLIIKIGICKERSWVKILFWSKQ